MGKTKSLRSCDCVSIPLRYGFNSSVYASLCYSYIKYRWNWSRKQAFFWSTPSLDGKNINFFRCWIWGRHVKTVSFMYSYIKSNEQYNEICLFAIQHCESIIALFAVILQSCQKTSNHFAIIQKRILQLLKCLWKKFSLLSDTLFLFR